MVEHHARRLAEHHRLHARVMPMTADDEQVVLGAQLEQASSRGRVVDPPRGHLDIRLCGYRASVREREVRALG